MGGNVETIKQRLDITEVISSYIKLEKAGVNFKARCPFHHEKTPSFLVSPSRQSFYCFGCGAKGDIFTFVEQMDGLDFKDALKQLAERAGVELKSEPGGERVARTEKERLVAVLEAATSFFEGQLAVNDQAKKYLVSRGISEESLKRFKLGYAPLPQETSWRLLYEHLLSLGFPKEIILKAGLAKHSAEKPGSEPYDVFRGRIIFPLADTSGKVVGFSGRAVSPDENPKYLNSPDTPVFNKSELLYGLDKAKDEVRRRDYTVLVEGQIDLVLSHQAAIKNTVASSGTAFTEAHLRRLKNLSNRLILAFDGDDAGEKAAMRSTVIALSLGMEVKIAKLPSGRDPADLILEDPQAWKDVLKGSKHAIEHFLLAILALEKDTRKRGKLVEQRILPLIAILKSSIEKSHFVSLVAQHTGIREEMVWEDLRQVNVPEFVRDAHDARAENKLTTKAVISPEKLPRQARIERRIVGIIFWQEYLGTEGQPLVDVSALKGEVVKRTSDSYLANLQQSFDNEKDVLIFEAERDYSDPQKLSLEVVELLNHLSETYLNDRRDELRMELSIAENESVKDEALIRHISEGIVKINVEIEGLRRS
jgi:DNA primase